MIETVSKQCGIILVEGVDLSLIAWQSDERRFQASDRKDSYNEAITYTAGGTFIYRRTV